MKVLKSSTLESKCSVALLPWNLCCRFTLSGLLTASPSKICAALSPSCHALGNSQYPRPEETSHLLLLEVSWPIYIYCKETLNSFSRKSFYTWTAPQNHTLNYFSTALPHGGILGQAERAAEVTSPAGGWFCPSHAFAACTRAVHALQTISKAA